MAGLCLRGAAPVDVKSSRSVLKGSSPSLGFRNVFACCDPKISGECTTRAAVTLALFSQPFAYVSRRAAVRGSVSPCPAPSEKRWCGIASAGASVKRSGSIWIG
jgi:hypothetical protein